MTFLLVLSILKGYPAGERVPAGARAQAMGGASVASGDFWALFNNQAGTAWFTGIHIGMSFENRFLLPALTQEYLGLAVALKAGTFGIAVNRFGNNQYNELKAGLSFSRKFGHKFSVGVQLHYLRLSINHDYGNKNLISCEIGLMYQAGKHLWLGVQLLNPIPVVVTDSPAEHLPSTFCIGMVYQFSDSFSGLIETEKDFNNPLIIRTGAEYHFARPAYVRVGMSTSPVSFTFGAGLEFGRFRFDIASGYHQALGFSPSGSIIYTFK